MSAGADPAVDKRAGIEEPTIADLAERFLTEHIRAKRKESTGDQYRRLIDGVIVPELGKQKVRDIARADIAKLQYRLRHSPSQTNRVLAVLSSMFNLAESWGLRPDGSNPCRHVERYAEKKRERMLTADELARLGDALGSYSGSIYGVAAIKLLIFTGARKGEILGLKWEWIDFERGEARLPDSKTGAKTLHLPPPALAVLTELPRLAGNPHVIVGRRAGAALVNVDETWMPIRAAAGLDDVRLHDLRHAFASVAASRGMSLPVIGKLLGHSQPATTHRYAHLAADPVKEAAAAIAGEIASAMERKTSGQVVVLR